MDPGEQATGTRDEHYNLISVLYHALQGADLYEKYATDAGGDQDLASFFREMQQQERQRAERAKQLLATRLQQGE
jgi:maltooligosyltrehalose synthase